MMLQYLQRHDDKRTHEKSIRQMTSSTGTPIRAQTAACGAQTTCTYRHYGVVRGGGMVVPSPYVWCHTNLLIYITIPLPPEEPEEAYSLSDRMGASKIKRTQLFYHTVQRN
jgi:hypothetical protein